jgi:hypothetical protein
VKNIIFLTVSMALTAPAFAMHAYRSETCTSSTHKLVYQGNYPVGGSYSLTKKDTEDGVELYEAEEKSVQENEFRIRNTKIISSNTTKAECKEDDYDFEETESKSQMVIELGALSAENEAKVGLKSGTNMIFNCDEVFSAPVKCK